MFCIICRYLVWGYNRQIAEDMHMVDKANLCSLELGRFTCSSDGRYHQTGWCIYWYSFLSELLASAFSDLEASLTITLDWTQPKQTTYQLFSWPCIHRLSDCSSIYSFILPFWSYLAIAIYPFAFGEQDTFRVRVRVIRAERLWVWFPMPTSLSKMPDRLHAHN